jgi:zinc/manganese transport system ATP-binding protein/zinc transport system ATP-binding protein
MQPLIELDNVCFGYGATPVLDCISMHLHPGQFAALVGPSGAGKTTLLKLVLGILTPNRGEIRIGGEAPSGHSTPQVSYVPQLESVDWNFPVTVEQVVLMGLSHQAWPWPWPGQQQRDRLLEVLDRLEIGQLGKRHIRDLSGGQQQRVFLARALITEPDLLVLDEPTAGVDMRTAENILHMLGHLNQHGITILMTTHDLNSAAAHVPWVICLNQKIIGQGPPEEVFTVETLNQTYRSDMIILRQDGMLFVQQKPHPHSYHDLLPNPVPGDIPDQDARNV